MAAAALDGAGEPPARYRRLAVTPALAAALARDLDNAGRVAAALPVAALLAAWSDTVEAFLDPHSAERAALATALAATSRLSPAGLDAALAAVLGGVRRGPASRLAAEVGRRGGAPVLVVLAGNLPALAVQPLLPALLAGRPVVLKSSSAEPLFAPAFLAALVARRPELGPAVAALVWSGGDTAVEAPLLAVAGTVLAYGDAPAIADLAARAPGRVVGYGPRTSLAVVGADVAPESVAAALARDVALLDQRGCLSVQAVYTAGDAEALARELAGELAALAPAWPPGPADTATLAAVQHLRLAAELRGLTLHPVADRLADGTVLVEPEPAFTPGPGLRTVRVHPLPDLRQLPMILDPWRDRLQGAALAGAGAEALAVPLAALGLSRLVAPGELQSPDASWHNGGVHPLRLLAAP